MGRIGSIILIVVFSACAGAAYLLLPRLDWFGQASTEMQAAALVGVVALGGMAVLFPLGFLLDRTLGRLARFTDAATDVDADLGPLHAPRLFAGITEPFEQTTTTLRERVRALHEDIKDQKVACRILETERDQLFGVLGALRDGVVVTDSFNEIITLNESASVTLGFDAACGARKPIADVISHGRLCQLIRETRDARDFADTRTVELEIDTEAGVIPFQVSLSSLANNKGDVGAVVTILHDLRREREIAQMKSDFVSKASHELRTPLSSIRAYVEMLVDGEADDEASRDEFYGIIQNETERLGRMIDNMLNISRIEAGIIQIDREVVDFRDLLRRAVETLEPQAKEKGISLSCKQAPIDLSVEGDPDMLYQVVLNLTSNAIKYTPEGGRVTLSGDSDNLTRSVVISVADTGLGVPPDALPRLFEKFYRIESFKRVAKGTGLGLNLCKHIVETVHHGQIGVESKLGMGSKFWFTVPMRFAGAKAA